MVVGQGYGSYGQHEQGRLQLGKVSWAHGGGRLSKLSRAHGGGVESEDGGLTWLDFVANALLQVARAPLASGRLSWIPGSFFFCTRKPREQGGGRR